jgi:hypothetical protein
MLNENASWMTPRQLRKHVNALNSPDEPSPLAWIWEVAVLNGLSKFVAIDHEPDLGSKPDAVFQVNGEIVIAEITTISDKSRHSANPIDNLFDELSRHVLPSIQAGLSGGFSLSIRELNPRGRGRNKEAPKLHIPRVEQFKEVIFTPEFDKFLDTLKRSPNQCHGYPINNAKCNLVFTFDPRACY